MIKNTWLTYKNGVLVEIEPPNLSNFAKRQDRGRKAGLASTEKRRMTRGSLASMIPTPKRPEDEVSCTAPRPTEKQLQSAILQYLETRHFLCWRNNSGMAESTNAKTGASYRIKLGKSGSPDIIGMTKSGQWLGIEVKGETGKQRESQIEFEQQVRDNHGIYLLVHSWDEFIAGMEAIK